MKRSEHLIQVLVVQVEVEVEVEQEKQVRAHHTLHWMLAEPPAKSSNYFKWPLCHHRCKGC